MLIKPAAGLKVRHNVTRQNLPEEGIDVPSTDGTPHDQYWQFLLRHGDVTTDEATPWSKAAEPEAKHEPEPAPHQADVPAANEKS